MRPFFKKGHAGDKGVFDFGVIHAFEQRLNASASFAVGKRNKSAGFCLLAVRAAGKLPVGVEELSVLKKVQQMHVGVGISFHQPSVVFGRAPVGWNDVGLNEDSSSYYHGVFSFPLSRSSVKMGAVVSPSDCVALGDTSGWVIANVYENNRGRIPWGVNSPFLSPIARIGVVPRYSFYLTRRHYGNANIAFLDGHVEHGSLRDWTLPIEPVHRRWHYDGKAHLDRLVYRDAENWATLRGMDEEIPDD